MLVHILGAWWGLRHMGVVGVHMHMPDGGIVSTARRKQGTPTSYTHM